VNRQDLRQLRSLIRRYVDQGRVVPTALDEFSRADHNIGPSIYTVTDQLIKPITDKAGKVSWALMLHPSGLLCCLFVTHCWAEGAYEFIDKVLNSWPHRARHAYCCMLSNPQNLDISSLISSPKDSPFAKALSSASYMLVVPNQRCSIYSRIWCVYEAFLAYSEDKAIITAVAPEPQLRRHAAASCALYAVAFGAYRLLTDLLVIPTQCQNAYDYEFCQRTHHVNDELMYIIPSGLFVGVITIVVLGFFRPSRITRAVELSLILLGGVVTAASARPRDITLASSIVLTIVLSGIAFTMSVASICATTVDRVHAIRADDEARQLRQGYKGRLRDAKASKLEDKDAILGELAESGLEASVNEAIQVLLDSGVSTPTMRAATKRAGKLVKAGQWRLSVVTITLAMWVLLGLLSFISCFVRNRYDASRAWAETWASMLCIAEAVAWLILFRFFELDRRSFSVRVLYRIFGIVFFGIGLRVFFIYLDGSQNFFLSDAMSEAWLQHVLCLFIGPLILSLSCMGPGLVAAVPGVGPALVRCLVVPLSFPCRCGCASDCTTAAVEGVAGEAPAADGGSAARGKEGAAPPSEAEGAGGSGRSSTAGAGGDVSFHLRLRPPCG